MSLDDLNGLTDFNPGDKTFQWKVASAQVHSTLEFGLFGSNGSMPRLTIRCTFGKKAYMLKIVDLERVNEIPKAGT